MIKLLRQYRIEHNNMNNFKNTRYSFDFLLIIMLNNSQMEMVIQIYYKRKLILS